LLTKPPSDDQIGDFFRKVASNSSGSISLRYLIMDTLNAKNTRLIVTLLFARSANSM